MFTFILVVHILVCSGLCIIVLLQVGKGAGLSSVFGAKGGADETLFGGKGAGGFLAKVTTAIAIIFMVTSLTLALITSRRTSESIVKTKSTVIEQKKETPTHPSTTKTSKTSK
jgi:preprotein translocase subunit SecG